MKKLVVFLLALTLIFFSYSVLAANHQTTDVVVIGSGAAGLAASIEAAEAGAEVILLEKMPFEGGSTRLSGGIVYATNSPLQKEQGIDDTPESLTDYWLERAEGNADRELLNLVAEQSGQTISWLMDNGVEFNSEVTAQGTSPVARGHTAKNGGYGLIEPLKNTAVEKGVNIMFETSAYELITNNEGRVTGVKAQDKNQDTEIEIKAEAVVLATGGFDRSEEMKEKYAPIAEDQISYSNKGNVGDGLKMAEEVGAQIIAKNGVIGFRGVAQDIPYTSALGGLIFSPTLYVDQNGNRFCNEASDYPIIYDQMTENGSELFYLIFDKDNYSETLEKGLEKDVAYKASSLDALAEKINIEKSAFTKTVENYNSFAENGKDEDFNKPAQLLNKIDNPNYYALQVKPATLGTFGGPKINLKTQVLNENDNPISGLYAAGEVANGQLFNKIYPASGSSIQMSFTLGRIAGENAAAAAE